MDITITGRGVGIPDRFEDYATEKADKVAQLAPKALAFDIDSRLKTLALLQLSGQTFGDVVFGIWRLLAPKIRLGPTGGHANRPLS